ncbi:MAG: GTPase ObgE [Syntrophomonadaceae bacterium]|nr:GTPase ObgE [Syntrophomonadaceae bacterium]
MFIDQARIFVKGGDGGNGVVAFRREKYVPEGGPAGGDGGRGGNVIFQTDEGLRTLMDFKYRRHYKAERGTHGQGKNMHGAGADDLVVKVPVGTIIKDADSGEVLVDLNAPGQTFVAARGGRGGRGNARFSSSTHRAPSFAENGEPGKEAWLMLELKLLADVGLVGFPNAGKSTLISKISAAQPKIADYPFTTLVPNLGVVKMAPGETFVVADIPGLIPGAHKGAGLGHEFLRHIERTRMLIIILDCSGLEEREPLSDYESLLHELSLYRKDLLERPRIIAANKMDAPQAAERLESLRRSLPDLEIFPISALTGQGTKELINRVCQIISAIPETKVFTDEVTVTRFKEEVPFSIAKDGEDFVISGERIEKLVAMTDFDNDEALPRFQQIIEKMGLNKALREKGVQNGDIVRIRDLEFEYQE